MRVKAESASWALFGFRLVGLVAVIAASIYAINKYLSAFEWPPWQTWLISAAIALAGMVLVWVMREVFLPRSKGREGPDSNSDEDDLPLH